MKRQHKYLAGWLLIGAAAVGLEALAIADPGEDGTLSSFLWALVDAHLLIRVMGIAGWLWFGWHIFGTRE